MKNTLIREKTVELIKLINRNYSTLWLDDLSDTVECIIAENINPVNDCEEEVTAENFDCEYDGHVLSPNKIPQGNCFDGDRIFTLVDELEILLKS